MQTFKFVNFHTHTHSVSLSGLLPAFQPPSSLKVRVISHTLRKLSAPCCCWNMKPIITDEMLSLRMLLIDSWPLKLHSNPSGFHPQCNTAGDYYKVFNAVCDYHFLY